MAPGVRQNAAPLSKGVHPGAGNNRQGCPLFGGGALNQGRGTSHWADPQNQGGVLHCEGGAETATPWKDISTKLWKRPKSGRLDGASPWSQGIPIGETPSGAEPGVPFWNSSTSPGGVSRTAAP